MQVKLAEYTEGNTSGIERGRSEILKELYVDRGLGCVKISGFLDVSRGCVENLLKKHGIVRPSQVESFPVSEDELRRLFFDELLTIGEVVEKLDVCREIVVRIKNYYDICLDYPGRVRDIRRKRSAQTPAGFFTTGAGYEMSTGLQYDDVKEQIGIHRLTAIAEFGTAAVAGCHVHHKNGISWDNRPENLVVKEAHKHMREHWHGEPLEDRISDASDQDVIDALRTAGYEQAADEISEVVVP